MKSLDRKTEIILLIVGCIIYALSMMMIEPITLIPGSLLGIATALHKLIHTQIGTVNLLLNIPILFLCLKVFGRKTLIYTVLIMIGTSGLIDLFMLIAPTSLYMPGWLIATIGGIVMGIGAGLLLIAGGTMAGTTALSRFINSKFEKISVGNALMAMDTVIILIGCLLLQTWSALLYSVIYTVTCSKTIDLVYYVEGKILVRTGKDI